MTRRRSDPGFGSGPPKYPGTFLVAFRAAISDLNWKVQRYLGNRIECLDEQGGVQVVGLENLYRGARRVSREEWPQLITEFLRQGNLAGESEELPTDLKEVAERILVRLGKPLQALSDESRVWSGPLEGTDLVLNLVIDYPGRMIYVTDKMVEDSGKSGDEWVERAVANLQDQTEDDCLQIIHEESGLCMCNVKDAYDSSRALILDTLLPESQADGYFVAVPNRDQLLVVPVGPAALALLPVMKQNVEKEFQTEPYPISDQIYWIRDGVWRRFPIDVQGDKVTIQPPPEFEEVFDRFVESEEEEGEEVDGSEGA